MVASFPAVPGLAVPGAATPGLVQDATAATSWQFYGRVPLMYFDYTDSITLRILTAVPGGSYSMYAVNSRAGLTVPPPDGRWVPGNNQDFLVFRPHSPSSLAETRAAIEQARVEHGHYAPGGCVQCLCQPGTPRPAVHDGGGVQPPLIRRVDGPDFAPQPSLAEMRAALEETRIAHGHYEPGGCRTCTAST